MDPIMDTSVVNSVAHLIQLSVAPVFLLAAVAGLLNVFVGRLVRIIDKIDKIELNEEVALRKDTSYIPTEKLIRRKSFLHKRLKTTNYAIALSTSAGLMVALVIVTMFLSAILKFDNGTLISTLFILAMLFLISSLLLFLKEISYTTYFMKKVNKPL
jgi:CBS domain containing-hemolysin-like protein